MSSQRSRPRTDPTFFCALPAYLGGKRRLCRLIFGELARWLPRERWSESTLLDPFSGGGAVALFAKAQGFDVVASDLAARAALVARALVANSSVRLAERDVLGLLTAPLPSGGGVASRLDVFTPEQAKWLALEL